MIVLINVCGVFTLTYRYLFKIQWENRELTQELSRSRMIRDFDFTNMLINSTSSLLRWDYIVDVLIMIASPIPYYDLIITMKAIDADKRSFIPVYYLLSDFILVFMFTRVIFVARAVINYSIFMDIYSKKLCKTYGFNSSNTFAIKCFVRSSPGSTISLILVCSVFLIAFALRIFELPYSVAIGSVEWYYYMDSCWCTIVTMTTVGYGDLVPATFFGRMVGIVAMCWGNFLMALLILSLSNIFGLNFQETKAMDHLLKTRLAAKSITSFMRFLLAKKNYNLDEESNGVKVEQGEIISMSQSANHQSKPVKAVTQIGQDGLIEQRVDFQDILKYERQMLVQL